MGCRLFQGRSVEGLGFRAQGVGFVGCRARDNRRKHSNISNHGKHGASPWLAFVSSWLPLFCRRMIRTSTNPAHAHPEAQTLNPKPHTSCSPHLNTPNSLSSSYPKSQSTAAPEVCDPKFTRSTPQEDQSLRAPSHPTPPPPRVRV